MITYEQVYKEYEFYKACYEKIDSYYWENVTIDIQGNVKIKDGCISQLKQMYMEYKAQCAEFLSILNDYQNSHLKLYKENIPVMRRNIEDYDSRLKNILRDLY